MVKIDTIVQKDFKDNTLYCKVKEGSSYKYVKAEFKNADELRSVKVGDYIEIKNKSHESK